MHVAPAAIGQTLVRHRPVQVVAETEPVATAVLEEVPERVPLVRRNEVRPVEGLGDQRRVDHQPGHRRLAEQDAILRRKLVDPGGDERLDRLGERLVVLPVETGRQQFQQVQRMTAGPIRQALDLPCVGDMIRGSGEPRRHLGQPAGVVGGERRQVDRFTPPCRLQTEVEFTAMDEHDEPRPVSGPACQPRDHVLRCAVEEMDVLRDQRYAVTECDVDGIRHDCEQTLPTEVLAEPIDLGRRVDLGPDGDGQQRQPARQLRGVRTHP